MRQYDKGDCIEIRVAVVGNVDSGKSTLLGVLSRGALDNGRGLARLNVFRVRAAFSAAVTLLALTLLMLHSINTRSRLGARRASATK